MSRIITNLIIWNNEALERGKESDDLKTPAFVGANPGGHMRPTGETEEQLPKFLGEVQLMVYLVADHSNAERHPRPFRAVVLQAKKRTEKVNIRPKVLMKIVNFRGVSIYPGIQNKSKYKCFRVVVMRVNNATETSCCLR